MRKGAIWGFVLSCIVAVSFFAVTPVERKVLNPDGTITAPSTKPSQVEVTNFPAVQAVSGTVNVGNLPAVQQVGGSVAVSNLPTDGSGRILVSSQGGSGALILHSTTATYQGNLGGRTGATQKCQAEFPGSHFAQVVEIQSAMGSFGATVVSIRGVVWLSSETQFSYADAAGGANCMEWLATNSDQGGGIPASVIGPKGTLLFNSGVGCDLFLPILCAE